MPGAITFDIFFLGLKDPSVDGRARFLQTMQRLTGAPAASHEAALSQPSLALFSGIDRLTALSVVDHLEQAGVRIEIRPNSGSGSRPTPASTARVLPPASQAPGHTPGPAPGGQQVPVVAPAHAAAADVGDLFSADGLGAEDHSLFTCPACRHEQPAGLEDCQRCGLVFAKYEREKLEQERRDQRLEDAISRQNEARIEWVQRAKTFLEGHPIAEEQQAMISGWVDDDENAFLVMAADEGPLVMTSRRLLANREGKTFSLPYELISDVDLGGGFVQRKNRERLQLSFHIELPLPTGNAKSLVWFLEKESAFFKDVLMDWVFARNFTCGSCGAPDLDYRVEGRKTHTRCMHCATDHEIRFDQAVAIPIFHD